MNSQDKMYILRYPDGGYVGLDSASGGYPYNAGNSLSSARIWLGNIGLVNALKYANQVPSDSFTLHELTITLTEIVGNNL